MASNSGASGESTRNSGEDDLASLVMPEVIELDRVAEARVMATLQDFNARTAGYFEVRPDEQALQGRRLGIVGSRLVYFRENDPSFMDDEALLMGIVAATNEGALPLSNPARLEAAGVSLLRTVQARLQAEGIDLSYADKGKTIDLHDDDHEAACRAAAAILREELAHAAADEPIVVQWLRHGGTNSEGQRTLKSDILRISVDGSGALVVERNPHKQLSVVGIETAFAVHSPQQERMHELIRLQRERVELSEEQQRDLTMYRTMEASARRAMMLALHRELGAVVDPSPPDTLLRDLDARLDQLPGLFREPLDTIRAEYEIEQIRKGALESGAWIYTDAHVRAALHDQQAFARLLSMQEPSAARALLRDLVVNTAYHNDATLPPFVWGTQGAGPARRAAAATESQASERVRDGDRGQTLGALLGLSSHVLPSSVLGVAQALGIRQSGQVYGMGERAHRPEAVLVYGTTDYSNMAELIQTAIAARAGGHTVESVYFADSGAHSIGSYVERILAPTIVALYGLDEAASTRLLERAGAFNDVFDADLQDVLRALDCPALTQHIAAVETVIGRQSTFAGLYQTLNRHFAERLGVQYRDAQELFEASGMTVGQLAEHIAAVARSTEVAYQQVAQRLRDAGVAEKRVQGMLQSLFGASGAWGAETRKFLRVSNGKGKVDLANLLPETRLADLRDMGTTLGGNAWAVLMRVLDFGRPLTIVGDKNTALGGNYAGSVVGDETTQITVTPIVRVVPDGNTGNKGDGLDITAYVLHPELVNHVAAAFLDESPNVRGGMEKMVVEVTTRTVWLNGRETKVTTCQISREPTTGGNRQQVRLGLL